MLFVSEEIGAKLFLILFIIGCTAHNQRNKTTDYINTICLHNLAIAIVIKLVHYTVYLGQSTDDKNRLINFLKLNSYLVLLTWDSVPDLILFPCVQLHLLQRDRQAHTEKKQRLSA